MFTTSPPPRALCLSKPCHPQDAAGRSLIIPGRATTLSHYCGSGQDRTAVQTHAYTMSTGRQCLLEHDVPAVWGHPGVSAGERPVSTAQQARPGSCIELPQCPAPGRVSSSISLPQFDVRPVAGIINAHGVSASAGGFDRYGDGCLLPSHAPKQRRYWIGDVIP